MLQTAKIEYQAGDHLLEGYYAFDDSKPGKKPAVLVAPDWSGRNDFACQKAEQLAELGYVGFALDMYGKGILGQTKEEKSALIKPLVEDRSLLRQRMLAAFETVHQLEIVNTARMGAIGFCFGGLCVLDLARSGAELRGVVSFHGLLNAPSHLKNESIRAKVLALHGHDDPMVPPEQVAAFQQEMTTAGVDWQLHVYGNTMHGFTNPTANDPGFGTVYSALADKRAWIAMKDFFAEVFAEK
jgi:dienelactone hydrolase